MRPRGRFTRLRGRFFVPPRDRRSLTATEPRGGAIRCARRVGRGLDRAFSTRAVAGPGACGNCRHTTRRAREESVASRRDPGVGETPPGTWLGAGILPGPALPRARRGRRSGHRGRRGERRGRPPRPAHAGGLPKSATKTPPEPEHARRNVDIPRLRSQPTSHRVATGAPSAPHRHPQNNLPVR